MEGFSDQSVKLETKEELLTNQTLMSAVRLTMIHHLCFNDTFTHLTVLCRNVSDSSTQRGHITA